MAVSDVDLSSTQRDLLFVSTTDVIECAGSSSIIQENDYRAVRGFFAKRVICEDRRNRSTRAHENAYRIAGMALERGFEFFLDFAFAALAFQHHVAACNVGLDGVEASFFADESQMAIGNLPVPPTLTARSRATNVVTPLHPRLTWSSHASYKVT